MHVRPPRLFHAVHVHCQLRKCVPKDRQPCSTVLVGRAERACLRCHDARHMLIQTATHFCGPPPTPSRTAPPTHLKHVLNTHHPLRLPLMPPAPCNTYGRTLQRRVRSPWVVALLLCDGWPLAEVADPSYRCPSTTCDPRCRHRAAATCCTPTPTPIAVPAVEEGE